MKELIIRLEKLIELRQAIQNRYEESVNPLEEKLIPLLCGLLILLGLYLHYYW